MRKSNIVLIGMPGSGKSTIGRILSNILNIGFIDCDEYIEQIEKATLQTILDGKGVKEFMKIEEARILGINVTNHVLAPGGSVIYYPKVIKHLKKSSIFVFLNVSFNEIQSRLKNSERRAIVGLNRKTRSQLFNERFPLYMKYADIIVDCSGKSKNKIVNEIVHKLQDAFQS